MGSLSHRVARLARPHGQRCPFHGALGARRANTTHRPDLPPDHVRSDAERQPAREVGHSASARYRDCQRSSFKENRIPPGVWGLEASIAEQRQVKSWLTAGGAVERRQPPVERSAVCAQLAAGWPQSAMAVGCPYRSLATSKLKGSGSASLPTEPLRKCSTGDPQSPVRETVRSMGVRVPSGEARPAVRRDRAVLPGRHDVTLPPFFFDRKRSDCHRRKVRRRIVR